MAQLRVLVVDDEDDCRTFLSTILSDMGLEVLTAADGEAGLRAAEEEKPHLVILDVQMPKMDGFSVFKKLKGDDATRALPVIMLTGVSERTGIEFSKEKMQDYFNAEPEAYLEKPIEPDQVTAAVTSALGL